MPSTASTVHRCLSRSDYIFPARLHGCNHATPPNPYFIWGLTSSTAVVGFNRGTEVPDLTLNSWYLDDGTLLGLAADLAQANNIIESDDPGPLLDSTLIGQNLYSLSLKWGMLHHLHYRKTSQLPGKALLSFVALWVLLPFRRRLLR
jgi:hypothetical protein